MMAGSHVALGAAAWVLAAPHFGQDALHPAARSDGHQLLRSVLHARTHSSYPMHLTSVRPSTQFSTGVVQ